jgi:tetratricopeptide (TPR) repeat protein
MIHDRGEVGVKASSTVMTPAIPSRTPQTTVHGQLMDGQSSKTKAGPESVAPEKSQPNPYPVVSRAEAAWEFIQSGEFDRAALAFTEATRLFPNEPSLLMGLGLSRYRLGQHDLAIAALARALELDVDVQHVHALLGELYFKRDELEASVRHYEAAARQDPNDLTVQDGLFTARRASQEEAHLSRILSPHFVLKFEIGQRRIANDVIDRLERLHEVVGRQLEGNSDDVMIVILYSDDRFKRLTGSPDWVGGLYDGKIHLASGTVLKRGQDADAALAHEYTHAIVHRLSQGHAPTWLQEGLALYFEGRPVAWGRDILARHRGELIPLHALHGSFVGLPPRDVQLAYAEAYSATRTIIDLHGLTKVRRLIEVLAVTPEFAAAFEIVFQTTYRDFEAAWVSRQTSRSA